MENRRDPGQRDMTTGALQNSAKARPPVNINHNSRLVLLYTAYSRNSREYADDKL